MKVAIISHEIAWADKEENIITIAELLNRVDKNCDIVILPELFSTGYLSSTEQLYDMAEDEDGISIINLQRWAQYFNFAICGSYFAKEQGKYYNRAFFVEPSGEITYYNKCHKYSNSKLNVNYALGNVKSPIIRFRGWNISMLVSDDILYPVWSRQSAKNIDLMLVPSSWPTEEKYKWKHILIGRAIENQIYIVGANRIGRDDFYDYNTPSYIFDFNGSNIAFEKNNILYAEIDKKILETHREKGFLDLNQD